MPAAKYRTDLLCRVRRDKDLSKPRTHASHRGKRCHTGWETHNSILDRPGSPRKGHRAPRVCVSLDRENMESGLMWGTGLRQSGDIIPAREQVYPWGAAKVAACWVWPMREQ